VRWVQGYLRWWPIEEIDTAEADYDNGILELLGVAQFVAFSSTGEGMQRLE